MSLEVARDGFMEGYARGARLTGPSQVMDFIDGLVALDPSIRPFSFEGAGMALRVRERREPGLGWLQRAVEGTPEEWALFLRLGVGCALARMSAPFPDDPDVQDGFGFQLGLTRGASGSTPPFPAPRAERGMGRATWFNTGGDAAACGSILLRGPDSPERWRGLGTACAFAGDPRGQARMLGSVAGDRIREVQAGAAEALRLWELLPGPTPARVERVLDTLRAAEPRS